MDGVGVLKKLTHLAAIIMYINLAEQQRGVILKIFEGTKYPGCTIQKNKGRVLELLEMSCQAF